MTSNKDIITNFYTAFQNKDYKTMQDCYIDNATFSDAVFENLNAAELKAMWQMLITRSTDLQIEFKNVEAYENTGSAEWIATYTFSASGNKVINKIKAAFVFEHGKIKEHKDSFYFYKWAKQAFGFKGLLLGWTSFFHTKVKQLAKNNLVTFMNK